MRLRDDQIDTSDIPEVTDWSKAVVGRFYRPRKESVTIRLDADVVAWLRAEGPGYQTRINAVLRNTMNPETSEIDFHKQIDRKPERNIASADLSGCPEFRFPNLEKNRELSRYCRVAELIEKRGSVFAPAA